MAIASHGRQRTHATVFFETASLIDDDFAWAFVHPCQQIAHHDTSRPCRQGLDDVSRVAQAAIGDDRHPVFGSSLNADHDGG